jgi:3-oxoacyl-[acyl-carrier protein] reductase
MRSATEAVAIVTDGACGIGRELANGLVLRGFAVVVVYLRDSDRAEAVIEEIVHAGGTAVSVRADVTDEIDVERLFNETDAAFGPVDVLVHAAPRGAGVLYRHAAVALRRGGTILSVAGAEPIDHAVAVALRDRDVTINGVPPGVALPGVVRDAAGLLALLDQQL